MEQFSYRITDPVGIHARPAGLIVKEADAKKIFAVMSLGIRTGEEIFVEIDGPDEKDAKTALSAVIGEHL